MRQAHSRLRARHARARGFTLIEAMVVIAIAAILTTIAIPTFVDMTQRNRASSEINSFVADIQYARSEAIKRGQPVSVCASSNATSATPSCLAANTWAAGWIVFQDNNGDGSFSSSVDTVMRVRAALVGSDTLTTSTGSPRITFGRLGFASNMGGSPMVVTLATTPVNANARRCVSINLVGRQRPGC